MTLDGDAQELVVVEVVIGVNDANVFWFQCRGLATSSQKMVQENVEAMELRGL